MGGRFLRSVCAIGLATGALLTASLSPASAITTSCDTGSAPAIPGYPSDLKLACSLANADALQARQTIHDYSFAQYHFGSARQVKVTYVSTTGKFTAQSGYAFVPGDVGHTVTASGLDQTCLKLPPAPSPIAVSLFATAEAASPNTLTVSSTTGSVSTAASGSKTITMINGSAIAIATGTTAFTACDVGRAVSGSGIQATTTVKTFINTKAVELSKPATAAITASARTFGAVTRMIKVNNTRGRTLGGAAYDGDTTLNVPGANFSTADNGYVAKGECIVPGTTITFADANNVTLSSATTCNAAAHAVTVDTSASNTTVTANPASSPFTLADVGRTLTETTPGTCLPASPATKITGFTNANTVTVNQNLLNCTGGTVTVSALGSAEKTISINPTFTSTSRMVEDADDASGKWISNTASFDATDIGTDVIKGGVRYRITAVGTCGGTCTNATTTPAAPVVAAGTEIQVGVSTDTAPVNGDTVIHLNSEVALQPNFVAGAAPCASGSYQGAGSTGTWSNPGTYAGPVGSRPKTTIAELVFPSGIITFYGYITPRGANATDEVGHTDPDTAPHTDVVLPSTPTGIAVCAGHDLGSGTTVIGVSSGTQNVRSGLGQPGSAMVRAIDPAGGTDTAHDTFGTASDYTGDSCTPTASVNLATNHGYPCVLLP